MEAPSPTCTISFSGAQRAWYDGSNLLGIEVLVDGAVVSTITPSDGNTFVSETTASFTVSQGSHTITLEGYGPDGHDITAFVDNVQRELKGIAPRKLARGGSDVMLKHS